LGKINRGEVRKKKSKGRNSPTCCKRLPSQKVPKLKSETIPPWEKPSIKIYNIATEGSGRGKEKAQKGKGTRGGRYREKKKGPNQEKEKK